MSSLHGRVPGLSVAGFEGRVKNLLDSVGSVHSGYVSARIKTTAG